VTRTTSSPGGGAALATATLDLEQDVVLLCRRARQAGERLGLPERAVQRLCAATFDVGRRLQALAPGARADLVLGPEASLKTIFHVDACRLGQPAEAFLEPVRSVVPRVTSADMAGTAVLTVGIDFPTAVATRIDPSLAELLASREALGVSAVAKGVAAVPLGATDLLQTALQRELHQTNRGIVAVYAELAEQTERLRLAERRLQLLLDSVQDYAICLLTADGQVSSTNVGAERLFECPAEEMVGSGFETFYLPADREAGVPAAQLVQAEREGRVESASLKLRRGRFAFDAHVILAPVRDEGRVLRGFSLVVRDITDRKQLESDLRRRAEDLAAANRAKEDFLATLSHELRTPLNAMLGWTRLLRMGRLDANGVARALDTIERNAHIQEQLIADILDVSRIVTGKLRFELRPTDLAPVVDATLDAVRPTAGAKSVELRSHLTTPGPVRGDPDRLQQVVWNLLVNAIKFTPAGGTITVVLAEEDGGAVVRVADTGEGIDRELLPFIFDRFRQGDASVTRPHGGIGLGLSIVRHIVEMHGGKVLALSEGKGKGTTFEVHLPLRAGSGAAPAAAAPTDRS
jgi:PAS domain S-box-containing protein